MLTMEQRLPLRGCWAPSERTRWSSGSSPQKSQQLPTPHLGREKVWGADFGVCSLSSGPPVLCDGVCEWGGPHVPHPASWPFQGAPCCVRQTLSVPFPWGKCLSVL